MHFQATHDVWDKLKNIYEGDDKVKQVKLQSYKGKFESMKMNEEDKIVDYLLKVDENFNAIKGLGE